MGVKLTTVTAGRTKSLGPFTLKINGAAYDLTGHTVNLKLRDSTSSTYHDTTGDITIDPDQTANGNRGKVYFKPDAADFAKADTRYFLKWEVIDGNGDVAHFPEEESDYIDVTMP